VESEVLTVGTERCVGSSRWSWSLFRISGVKWNAIYSIISTRQWQKNHVPKHCIFQIHLIKWMITIVILMFRWTCISV